MANKTDLIENQNGVGKNKRLQMRDWHQWDTSTKEGHVVNVCINYVQIK